METKYGNIPNHQIDDAILCIRKSIFFLLLYVDPNEQIKFSDVDVNKAFDNVIYQLMGFNKLLLEPPEIPIIISTLESAKIMYNSDDFSWQEYRKLILDAGNMIMDVKEGDC